MAGWDGSGNFTVPYLFVNDAAANINILASRQDTQWATVVAGLMNCQTRDGQNKPSANWDFNGKKITNAANGSAPQDYVTFAQLPSALSEWNQDTHAFIFVSGTQFKFTGIDLTATYTPGRRLKIIHNSGGTTSYVTIVSSVFVTDTTITVAGATLVSTLTAVYYGLISYVNPSYLSPASAVTAVNVAAAQTGITGGVPTKVQFTTKPRDALGEFDAVTNYRFSPIYPGNYLVSTSVVLSPQNVGAGSEVSLMFYLNGSIQWGTSGALGSSTGNPHHIPLSMSAIFFLNPGSYIEIFAAFGSGTTNQINGLSGTIVGAASIFTAHRIEG